MTNIKIFFSVIGLLILGTVFAVVIKSKPEVSAFPGKYDTFAQCLKEKGVTFYGAFWCPHCKKQKELFGTSVKFLKYVECSLPDASGQTQECKDKKIEGYPTWELADGTRLPVENASGVSLETLSAKTSCALPQ
ncbi:MAG: thioredoxin domain-containing protein [Candidatus Nomurabacteria bacterium]|nr:thioredoxin domain-containing protein [Candidatus Nomurabacteria bacterium]